MITKALLIHSMNSMNNASNYDINALFKMHPNRNVCKIREFCFEVIYLITNQRPSSTIKRNTFFITKTLANAP